MRQITFSARGRTILGSMLILFTLARMVPREAKHDGFDDEPYAALGHVGLTVIALVFVLLDFWKG